MTKKRILIVDDDLNISRLTAIILENSGLYEVMIVNQSTRALSAAIQFKPAVMLLDVDMPDKCGGDIANEASRDSKLRDIPILFLTGLVSRAEAGARQIERGGMTFLSKPVEPALLLSCIAELTHRELAA
jgi:CheY-like chemotaxis protein